MSDIKERILGAISVMDDVDAEIVWNLIVERFPRKKDWDSIQEEAPDEIDLKMLDEIKNDPECHEFLSEDEAMKELGI